MLFSRQLLNGSQDFNFSLIFQFSFIYFFEYETIETHAPVFLTLNILAIYATSHIIQAISMTVQRGNATSIMGTLGPLRKLEDFFDVISPQEEES